MLIVVEGKNDKNKLENIFKDANIIITNGSEISQDTLNTIKSLSENNEVVLCLDPDGPGEKIRKKIIEYVPNAYNVYADKQKAISRNKKKVGIEHMSKKDICELFEHIYVPKYENNITYEVVPCICRSISYNIPGMYGLLARIHIVYQIIFCRHIICAPIQIKAKTESVLEAKVTDDISFHQ